MRVLGIDPGLASTGLGIIEESRGRLRWVYHDVVRTVASGSTGSRLAILDEAVRSVVRDWQPAHAGIEALYFARNVTSALPVAEARGVIILALHDLGVPCREFTPQVIKQSVVGSGQADKEQVIHMVRVILGMQESPRPDHAADALAVAVTMLHSLTSVVGDVQ